MDTGFCELKQLSVSGACNDDFMDKPYHEYHDAYKNVHCNISVTPRRKTVFKQNIILKAQIRDKDNNLRWFKPEIDNGCMITCIHP